MTDKKAERLLNSEADAIIDENREKILGNCGVKEKEHKAGRIILKALAVAASVAFIAAFAYVCYLPIYMQEHGLTPGMQPSDTVDTSKITAPVTSETGPALSSAEETPADPVQTGEKLTLDAVIGIIASSNTYKEMCDKIAEIGEFAGIYGSGIVRTAYTLYSDYSEGEAVGYLTVSDLNIGFTVGPNSYVLCRSGDCLPSAYGGETDPVTGEKIIRIDEYMKSFTLPDESETALKSIYIESVRICTSGRKILIPVSEYTTEFIRHNYSKMPETVNYNGISYYHVDTAFNKDFYLVFLASVQTFKDSWWAVDPVCIKAGQEDSVYLHYLVFSTDYLKMGYASLSDYAVDLPEDLTEPDTMTYYKIGFMSAFVHKYPKSSDKTDLAELWFSQLSNESGYECDYGEYNGYRVRLVPGMAEVISDIEVGGYSFIFGSSFEIKAEKNGVSYSLKAAYKKGFLTEDDIAKINMIHRSLYGLYYDSPEELEKAVRYNAGLTEIMNNNTDQNEINRLQLSLFKSIYGSAGTDPVEEITLPDYSEYKGKFAPDSLLICIVKKSDGSEYTVQDFPELELTAVDKLMDYKDGTCSLGLYLKNPGEENVLEAIRLMLERSDVKYAEPNWIATIDD